MINRVIQWALEYRLFIVIGALALMVLGSIVAVSLPIDVLPSLTRPRVVLITEAHGMAPEEVEQLVTVPLETAINGASGVIAVRSSSDIGLSVITVEFDWGTDVYTSRQIVQERLATATDRLPEGVRPQMGPVSSLLGQIMLIGMWSKDGSTDPLEVRTLADWVVRQRLLAIPGVSQVITMGGGRKQYQVLVDPQAMRTFEVSLQEIEQALAESNLNVNGGFVEQQSREYLVRGIGRITSLDDLRQVVVKRTDTRPILLEQVARITEGAQLKRGDSTVNGHQAVVLTIQKQPGADTRQLTDAIVAAVREMRPSLPDDVVIDPTLYQQRQFIDHGVANVMEALEIGAVLVVVVLFLFLLNVRTTLITLTAIPLSIVTTALVFRWFGMSINVMTLGGLAVALGELVDDAIVDVENIFRRLRENARSAKPRSALRVIYDASVEVRSAIVVSTVLVIVVFAPLFALSGIEGRLFRPLATAYLVSILASLAVSLTVTPVLSYYLLPRAKATHRTGDGFLLRFLKRVTEPVLRFSMNPAGLGMVLSGAAVAVVISGILLAGLGTNFLPPFDEGAAQVNLYTEPGTSLQATLEASRMAEQRFAALLRTEKYPNRPLLSYTGRAGRAEEDEHAMAVNVNEYVLTLNPNSPLARQELMDTLHHAVDDIPGVESEVEQPIAHMISHMLSGVTAQIAIKIFGDDLEVLRNTAQQVKQAIADVPGIAEPFVEQQQVVPQLRIEVDRSQLAFYGINAAFVHEMVETAMNGRVVSQVIEGQRTFDLLVRFDEPYRTNLSDVHRLPLDLPDGTRIPLSAVAKVYEAGGPNTIQRDDTRRRIVVRVNTTDRDLGSAVEEIKQSIAREVKLPQGYFIVYAGQFEAQQSATRLILWLSGVALVVMLAVLYSTFPSLRIVLQILLALPAAFIGGVLALVLTGQTLSVAAMVGFISLGGIAARNGLLLVSRYLDLVPEEGFSREMIIRGSLDRLAPVLMTALTTGLGLVPLVIGGHLPGKEILLPVATVILGGLITSTLCELLLRPGLFWALSEKDAVRLAAASTKDGSDFIK